jgi:hypothetical protein
VELRGLYKELKDRGMNFNFCIPSVRSSDAANVVADVCTMLG